MCVKHECFSLRFESIQNRNPLPNIGPNHTEYLIAMNNSDGYSPFVTKVRQIGIGMLKPNKNYS